MAAAIVSMSTSGEGRCFERQSVILRDTEAPAFWQAVVLNYGSNCMARQIDVNLE